MVTLVVEDGTGLVSPKSNCYASLADSWTYHESVGHTAWTAIPVSPQNDLQAQAKLRGAAYIDRKYATQWPGTRVNGREQGMAWPREDALDQEGEEIASDSVPKEVIVAAYEAEWREFQNPGALSPDVVAAQQVLSEKVGSLAVTYSNTTSKTATIPTVTEIDDGLANIIGTRSGTQNSNVERM